MLSYISVPSESRYGIIHDRLAEMASRLERIARLSAQRCNARTSTLGYGICVMVYVRDGYAWQARSGGQREMESVCCHPFAGRFECDRRQPERGAQKRGEASSEAVANQPDVSMRKERAQVVDEFLNAGRSGARPEEWLDGTYDAGRVK